MKKIIIVFMTIIIANTFVNADLPTFHENKTTWKNLGIGIDNPGEITDWTYYGIKTAEEASLWIDALKPLGDISYAGAARIWKQNGYTVNEVKEWVLVGAKTQVQVKSWIKVGINAEEAQRWKNAGITTPQQVLEWLDASYSLDEAAAQIAKGYFVPSTIPIEKNSNNNEETKQVGKIPATNNNSSAEVFKDNHTEQKIEEAIKYEDPVFKEQDATTNSSNAWQVFILVYFVIMIVTIFKGYGENRTVIIFRDYNDLGLTFLIPSAFILIFYLFMMFGGNPSWGAGLSFIVSMSLFSILVKNTYHDNNRDILPTTLSIITKVPLGIIWIFSFITMLNPSGKTAAQRRKNRGTALVIGALITPIIGMLVVEKEGSLFNPRDWIKDKRIGSIRNHL